MADSVATVESQLAGLHRTGLYRDGRVGGGWRSPVSTYRNNRRAKANQFGLPETRARPLMNNIRDSLTGVGYGNLGTTGFGAGQSHLLEAHKGRPYRIDNFNPTPRRRNINTIDSFSEGYTSWFQPEVGVVVQDNREQENRIPSTSQKAASVLEKKLSLEQLADNYIVGRRRAYIEQGRRQFRKAGARIEATNQQEQYRKRREYLEAYDTFSLADAVSVGDPEARSEVKLAMMYAGIASQQYSLAVHALEWLLTPDARTGRLPDPLFLNRIGSDIDSFYGPNGGDYLDHASDLNRIANQASESAGSAVTPVAPLWGLAAVMLWPKDKDRALIYVKQLAQPDIDLPWARLPELIEQANAASRSVKPIEDKLQYTSKHASDEVNIGLPFDLPEEAF